MRVSGGNAIFLSISLLWFNANSSIWLTQTYRDGIKMKDSMGVGVTWDFPGGSDGKESACNEGDLG